MTRKTSAAAVAATVLILATSSSTYAKHSKPGKEKATTTAPEDREPRKPRPIDQIQKEIGQKHKSKSARIAKQAYAAIQDEDFSKAMSLAATLKDPLFADYANWIGFQAHLAKGQAALEEKHATEALHEGEAALAAVLRIPAKSPYSPMLKTVERDAGLAEVLAADAQALAKKWSGALSSFERGFQRLNLGNSLGLVRPGSLLNYAQTCAAHESEFCSAWIARFSSIYPKNSPEMLAILEAYPSAADRPRPALVSKVTQNYKAPDLDQTAFDSSIALYMDGKFGAAIKGFRQFIDEFPKSTYRFRARYWLAQALTHEQDHDQARKAYEDLQHDSPLTYYGLLSAFARAQNMDSPISSTEPLATERDPLLLPHETMRLRRAEQFLSEGATELAAIELKDFRSRDALSSGFLMYLAALHTAAGTYSAAFSVLGDLVSRGYDGATTGAFLNLVFPPAYQELISKQADTAGVDPILILSLIKQESAFDPTAGSNVGAVGLMQLMPATATDTDSTVVRADLIDPETNVRVGIKYLKQLLTRFNGNIALALAGYNAGPNAADRWFREFGSKRGITEFIELIPYKETREYVAAIIRNYYWYSRKLNPNAPVKPLSHFWGLQGPVPSPTPTSSAIPGAVASPTPSPSE